MLCVTYVLLGLWGLLLWVWLKRGRQGRRAAGALNPPSPPGPQPSLLLGSLSLLSGDPNPWEVFRRLKERYGDVYRLWLGGQECVVVSSLAAIEEVLHKKKEAFSSRPNFLRYHALFGGDRNNSLALCDWSELQKSRRRIAYPYVFPRSTNSSHLEASIQTVLDDYFRSLRAHPVQPAPFDKAHFSAVCANMFYGYLCSKRYAYADAYFMSHVRRYDDIFHDINNGFALDFLPALLPFKLYHLAKLYRDGQYIRRFLNTTLIAHRLRHNHTLRPTHPRDFLDALLFRSSQQRSDPDLGPLNKIKGLLLRLFDAVLNACLTSKDPQDQEGKKGWLATFKLSLWARLNNLQWMLNVTLVTCRLKESEAEDSKGSECFKGPVRKKGRVGFSKDDALYELEDLLGGHSAVACFFSRLVAQIVNRPDVKHRLRLEVEALVAEEGEVRMEHRSRMHYVQAVVWETLRVTTSPIVPHVAVEDSSISGYHVGKGSIVFLNNYYLNLSDKYWKEPQNFDPDRFLDSEGHAVKPAHFLPFSQGQRSCLGFQLLYNIVFLTTARLFAHFDLSPSAPTAAPTPSAPTTSSCTLAPPHQPLTRKISRDVACAKLSVYDTDVKAFLTPRAPPPGPRHTTNPLITTSEVVA